MKKYEMIDYLKGFAIISIVAYHLIAFFINVPSLIKQLSAFGGAGVHLFFLLSGLGLTISYYKKKKNYFEFISSRMKKIYIPYIIIVTISFFTTYMYTYPDKIQAFLSHVFLYKMFINKYISSFGIQFWYISTLIQFYLLFYLIMRIKDKINNNNVFFIISCIISLVYAMIVSIVGLTNNRSFSSFFLQYLWEFCFGIVVADKIIDNKKITQKNNVIIIITIICLIVYGVMSIKGGTLKNFNDPFSLFAFTGIAIIAYKIALIKKICLFMSNISYELYLTHYIIFETVFLLNWKIPNYMLGIVAVLLAIVFSIIYKKILETINTSINSIKNRGKKNDICYSRNS